MPNPFVRYLLTGLSSYAAQVLPVLEADSLNVLHSELQKILDMVSHHKANHEAGHGPMPAPEPLEVLPPEPMPLPEPLETLPEDDPVQVPKRSKSTK